MSSRDNRIVICAATMQPEPDVDVDTGRSSDLPGELGTFSEGLVEYTPFRIRYNTSENNHGIVGSYQDLYELTEEPLLAFIHDDVVCKEKGWDQRVLAAFEDPRVGLVGFGGALGHGDRDLYKMPYRVEQLRRFDYLSNVDDAEVHGARFSGDCGVAVLDGFCLIVRRDLLDRAGGWRGLASGVDFFCYDYAISAVARRLGYHLRLVGVRCAHLGGRTSVLHPSAITSQEAFDKSHRWFYETYRDVMPARVGAP